MRFEIKALDARNQVVALRLEAPNEATARGLAEQQGFAVIAAARGAFGGGALFEARGRFPTTLFSIELLALLEAGLNLLEALQALSEKDTGGERGRVLGAVLDALRKGEAFSQALQRFPEYFSPLYIATVRASERTGNLKEALGRYIAYQEELDRVKKKLIAASIYPAILMGVGTLVLAFLLFYVVPRFASVYDDVAVKLPFFSALLLGLGHGIKAYAGLVLTTVAAVAVSAAYALSQDAVRGRLIERLWRMPGLGEQMRTYQLARLYRTLGMLLRAGIPVVRALDMVSGLLAAHLGVALERARRWMEEGKPISTAMTNAGLATPVATRLMRVGEESGRMGELMDRIARFHDEETSRFADTFLRVLEPLLMAILGVAVGLVVVLMYMPIFELAGSLQ